MKWEQFKNRFRKEARQEEVEVDASAIWEAIASDVDALNQEKPRRRRFIFWLLLSGIALAGLTGLWYFNLVDQENALVHNQSTHAIPEQQQQASTATIHSSNATNNSTARLDSNDEDETIASSHSLSQSDQELKTTSNAQDNSADSNFSNDEERSVSASELKPTSSSNANVIDNQQKPNPINPLAETERPKTQDVSKRIVSDENSRPTDLIQAKNIKNVFDEEQKPANSKFETVDQSSALVVKESQLMLPSLSFSSIEERTVLERSQLNNQTLQPLHESNELAESIAARKNNRKSIQFFIKTTGGISSINRSLQDKNGSSSILLQNRSQSETPLEAIQYGLSFGLAHRSGFRFSLGWQNTRIAERFDFTETRATIDSIEGVKILRINTQGDTIPVLGMIPRTTTTTNQIKVHNSYRLIDIPLSIAYYHSFNEKWALGIEAMIAANLSLKTEGAIADENELEVDIESNQSTTFKSSVGLNYQFGLSVGRTFADKLELSFSPFVRVFPKDFSVQTYSIAQKYVLMGGQLGLMYRF